LGKLSTYNEINEKAQKGKEEALSLHPRKTYFTASLKALPAENFGSFFAAILIVAQV
jgi:hypothetical protein